MPDVDGSTTVRGWVEDFCPQILELLKVQRGDSETEKMSWRKSHIVDYPCGFVELILPKHKHLENKLNTEIFTITHVECGDAGERQGLTIGLGVGRSFKESNVRRKRAHQCRVSKDERSSGRICRAIVTF